MAHKKEDAMPDPLDTFREFRVSPKWAHDMLKEAGVQGIPLQWEYDDGSWGSH